MSRTGGSYVKQISIAEGSRGYNYPDFAVIGSPLALVGKYLCRNCVFCSVFFHFC